MTLILLSMLQPCFFVLNVIVIYFYGMSNVFLALQCASSNLIIRFVLVPLFCLVKLPLSFTSLRVVSCIQSCIASICMMPLTIFLSVAFSLVLQCVPLSYFAGKIKRKLIFQTLFK